MSKSNSAPAGGRSPTPGLTVPSESSEHISRVLPATRDAVVSSVLTLMARLRPIPAVRVPLPQHPLAGTVRRELDVAGVAETLGAEFLEFGLSNYELPVLAALLTVASEVSDGAVVDLAGRLTVAGALCSATLPNVEVLALRDADDECAALSALVEANSLDMTVDRYLLDERRIADQLEAIGVRTRVIIVDMDNSVAVLRSAQRSIRSERPVILVPSSGDLGGMAAKTRNLLRRESYVGYRLSPSTTFRPRRRWSNPPRSSNPYVMLCPEPIDDGFMDRFDWWLEELAAAVPAHRSNVETGERIRRAYRDGGVRRAFQVGISDIRAGSRTHLGHLMSRGAETTSPTQSSS